MHEATIAQAILRKTVETYENRMSNLGKHTYTVKKVMVQIGEFRNVDPDSLEFAFSALRKDFSGTENAELEICRVEALAVCNKDDQHEFHPEPVRFFACTECGGGIKKLLRGDELDIVSIEIEEIESPYSANMV